jgi:hypothetical protein
VNLWAAHCYRVKNNDWPPSMVAAHHTAVHRSLEVNYAAANLTNYTESATLSTVYRIPDPFVKTDRPTWVEETTDLNGGVSTVGFHTDGTPYIVRSITTYSWTGSSSTADYRAREGHLPSVLFKFWEDLEARLITENQPNFAPNPPAGGKSVDGFLYPKSLESIANTLIMAMCGAYQSGKALLDPGVLDQMLKLTAADLLEAGMELAVFIACVRHNNKSNTIVSEISAAA